MREQLKELTKQYDKSEDDLKALQSVGQVKDALPSLYLRFAALLIAELRLWGTLSREICY